MSDTTLTQQIEVGVSQFTIDVGLLHQIVHGDATVTVQTEGGSIKSAAKAMADLEAEFGTSGLLATVEAVRDQAEAHAAAALGHANNAAVSAATITYAAYGLRRDGVNLVLTTGDDPFLAYAQDDWLVLPGGAVFSLNAETGHLEVQL